MLRNNNLTITGTKPVLLERIADAKALGNASRCRVILFLVSALIFKLCLSYSSFLRYSPYFALLLGIYKPPAFVPV